jgi:protein-disulfide isomerase
MNSPVEYYEHNSDLLVFFYFVKKIDAVQASVKNISTAASKADNKPKQNKRKPADPNYAHNIPQGNSFFIGNPNAKVTITEHFDIQ